MRKAICLALSLVAISQELMAQKIIAKEIVIVDTYSFRSDETLCHGIAKQVANEYLSVGLYIEKEAYCRKGARARMLFPASSCSLPRMTRQCVDEIQNPSDIKKGK